MAQTGKVFEKVNSELADFTVTVQGEYKVVDVIRNSVLIMRIPFNAVDDDDEIKLRLGNVVRQTAFKDYIIEIVFNE